jgi:hypothetical protein
MAPRLLPVACSALFGRSHPQELKMDAMSSPESALSEEHAEHRRSLRRAAYLTIAVGATHAVLFLLSFWLLSTTPNATAPATQLIAFYRSDAHRRVILVGLYLMPFAGIAFIWFIVALRMWITGRVRRENILLSNVQLVSGILYVAFVCASAGALSATAADVEFSDAPIDPMIIRLLPSFGHTIIYVFAMRMAAMFVFTTSTIGRTGGVLPRWFVWMGYAVGLFLLLSATFSPVLVVVFPLWLLALCALLLRWAFTLPADAIISPAQTIPLQ